MISFILYFSSLMSISADLFFVSGVLGRALLALSLSLAFSLSFTFSLLALSFSLSLGTFLGTLGSLSLSLLLRAAVSSVNTGDVDGDLLLGVLRILFEVELDLGALFEGLEAIFGLLLDLSEVDQDVVSFTTFRSLRSDESDSLVVQPLGDDTGLSGHLGCVLGGLKLKLKN